MNERTLDDGHDGPLLNSRGTLETVGIDTTKQLGLQVHGIERVGNLIIVGLDLTCSVLASISRDEDRTEHVSSTENISRHVKNPGKKMTYPRGDLPNPYRST